MDAVDRASLREQEARDRALAAHNEKKVKREHLIDGNGRRPCSICYELIDEQRVEAFPEVTTCIVCQRKIEIRNKHRGIQ